MTLENKVAVVTGASGGIGRAVAIAFAEEGAKLCLASRSADGSLASRIAQDGGEAIEVATDVSKPEQVQNLIDTALDKFGRIDVLVNVAGTISFGAAETLALEEWNRVLDVNLTGTFLCCQAVIGIMRRQGSGRIINMGSVVGKNGGNARPWIDRAEQDQASNIAYGVSKTAVHTLSFFLARELAADGITVNVVAPGPIASEMTVNFPEKLRALIPVGRMGTAEEVAHACVFLASDKAGFITGEVLDVNGGMWSD